MTGRLTMDDDRLRAAFAPYRDVEPSERLRRAVTQASPGARSTSTPARSRLVVGGIAVGLAVVVAAILMLTVDGRRAADPQSASRPLDLSDARAIVFADGVAVNFDELFDAGNHARLRDLLRDHDVDLVVHEVPVDPRADGRVYTVSVPAGGAEELSPGVYRIQPGARIDVEVGRADAAAGTAGLTLYEVFPQVEAAVDRNDPAATGAALEALGFQVHWVLIEDAGVGGDVAAPPPGTVVISVLGPNGEWTSIDPAIDTLMVEIGTPSVAAEVGH